MARTSWSAEKRSGSIRPITASSTREARWCGWHGEEVTKIAGAVLSPAARVHQLEVMRLPSPLPSALAMSMPNHLDLPGVIDTPPPTGLVFRSLARLSLLILLGRRLVGSIAEWENLARAGAQGADTPGY